ncbi:MAG: phage Gp37/Gp68 family protein [Pseudomonadota bacterium]|nr:phage Gp37/Gp68 family protein [Pseudomonadota bacterium]
MGLRSAIEWTESTWNPVTGCTKVSPGCKYCYAERMAERLQAIGQENYRHGFRLTLQPHMLDQPLHWKRPQTIFVNSMSDLFHKDVPLDYIQRVFDVMRNAHWHRFQVLTKRSARLAELDPKLEWAPNIWIGVSVESDKYRSRIDGLRATRALIKFLSEVVKKPTALGISRSGGARNPHVFQYTLRFLRSGETRPPFARDGFFTTSHSVLSTTSTCAASTGRSWAANQVPRHGRWIPRGAIDLRDQCRRAKLPFFFKQWGGKNKKQAGRVLDGRTWDEMPMPPDTAVPMVRPRGRRTSLAVVP